MQSPKTAYLAGASGVIASRMVSLGAGFLSLWFLTRILSTEQFAGYSVAMSVVILASSSVGIGIERVMLLRVSEVEPCSGQLMGRTLALKIFGLVGTLSILAALALMLFSEAARLGVQEDLNGWLIRLAPFVPAAALSLVLVTWFQANHRVGVSELMTGLTDGSRCIFFGIAFLFGLGSPAVALAATMSAAMPIPLLLSLAIGRTTHQPSAMTFKDLLFGLHFLTMRLSRMGLNHLDIVALGMFAGVTETAQYVVASRFAAIVMLGPAVFAPTYEPRVRRLIALGDSEAISREYHSIRVIAFACALVSCVVFTAIGRPVLTMFGEFGVGYSPFLLLLAGHLAQAGFGVHGSHLSMTGDIALATVNRVGTLAVFVVCLIVLVPPLSAIGAALSFLIASVVYSLAGAAILFRRGEVVPITFSFGSIVFLAGTFLSLAALTSLGSILAAGLLTICFVAVLLSEKSVFIRMLSGQSDNRNARGRSGQP